MIRRFPAEWEPHEATLFTWPWNGRIWEDLHADARASIAAAIAALSHDEDVVVSVPDAQRARHVKDEVDAAGGDAHRVECILVPSNDVWVRDHGPTFVLEEHRRVAIDWNFNAWGRKFPHAQDARVAARLAARFHAARHIAPIVFEGGAIETDGKGTLLTTESVAFTDTRNPGVPKETFDDVFEELLGVNRIVWLKRGMACDDTDGHIDTLARFTPSGRLLAHGMHDSDHPDHGVLADNARQLEDLGEVDILAAPTIVDHRGDLLPASYANFYVGNGVVLVPSYRHDLDGPAAEQVGAAFPDRRVVQIDCHALVRQGGAIHCATQQVPVLPD